jgi:UDP-N-acetylmuramate: L-alanyl-gamma-D-glutamyl-meso-diaminopimelate ligase
VNLIPRRGSLVAFDQGESLERSIARAFCPVERYGSTGRTAWQIVDLKFEADRTTWTVLHQGKRWADLQFPLAGEYNVWNATAAAAIAAHYGISKEAIADALRNFKSVKRRLEVRAEIDGVTIIDDFAHHPTAIAATLKALRSRYPQARLWALLEPRSNTLRRNVFQHELAQSLSLADEIVIASVFKSESIAEAQRLDLNAVIAHLKAQGHHARMIESVDKIVSSITPELRSGDVVAILSNGGFDGIYEKLPAALKILAAPLNVGANA